MITRADFESKLAATRAAIAQRRAERTLKAKADVEATQRRAAEKAQRRADAQATAIEERRLAHEARLAENGRLKTQAEFAVREAAKPQPPVPDDKFPPIPGAKWVRGTMARETWDGLHMFAQRRALAGLMVGASPTEIERARKLLDAAPQHCTRVREEIFARAAKRSNDQ